MGPTPHQSPDFSCRIDFEIGIFICNGPEGINRYSIVVSRRTLKKKDEITLKEALAVAGIEADIEEVDVSIGIGDDMDGGLRVYVPGYSRDSGMGFLYNADGKFGFRKLLPAHGNKIYVAGANSNVILDVVGREIPTREEFEKAVVELWNILKPIKRRDIVMTILLYPYAYVHFMKRPIIALTAPFRTGKTSIVSLLETIWGRRYVIRANSSLAAVRSYLSQAHVVVDDFGEKHIDDPNIDLVLSYYDRAAVLRVSPDSLRTRSYYLRGALMLAGAYVIRLLHLASYASRIALFPGQLSQLELQELSAIIERIGKDVVYYRHALAFLYLYPHIYYPTLGEKLRYHARRDPISVLDFINTVLIAVLGIDFNPPKNLVEYVVDYVDDVYVAVFATILKALIKKRAEGFKHNLILYVNGEPVEYYRLIRVDNIILPSTATKTTDSLSLTKTPMTKSITKSTSSVTERITKAGLASVIEMYGLSPYFMIETTDGKHFYLYVRADKVDDAIKEIALLLDSMPFANRQIPNYIFEKLKELMKGG